MKQYCKFLYMDKYHIILRDGKEDHKMNDAQIKRNEELRAVASAFGAKVTEVAVVPHMGTCCIIGIGSIPSYSYCGSVGVLGRSIH